MAQELALVFRKHNIEILYPVEPNELFVKLLTEYVEHLQQNNYSFGEAAG